MLLMHSISPFRYFSKKGYFWNLTLLICLMATCFFVVRSLARTTRPKFPFPRTLSTSYLFRIMLIFDYISIWLGDLWPVFLFLENGLWLTRVVSLAGLETITYVNGDCAAEMVACCPTRPNEIFQTNSSIIYWFGIF